MLFQSERLYSRFFTIDDLEVFYRLNGDEEVMRYIRAPKTYEECRTFLEQVISWYTNLPVNWRVALVLKETAEVIGSFAIMPLGNTSDQQLGYSLLKSHWGRGYATEITQAGILYAFDVLGYDSITALTEDANSASQNVLLKSGFRKEGEDSADGRKLLRFRINK